MMAWDIKYRCNVPFAVLVGWLGLSLQSLIACEEPVSDKKGQLNWAQFVLTMRNKLL